MMNLLEPWVALRLVAGLVALALFVRAALTAQKVLRHFDLARATEGQLALEKRFELAATFARVAAVVQVGALVLSVLAADRMSRAIRGAMCGYGVFSANEWGFRALGATCLVAIAAGVLAQVFAFDGRVRTLELARPLAVATCLMAPLSLVDLILAGKFLLGLDLSVVASCCSVRLDAVATAEDAHAIGPRVLVTVLALALTSVAIASAVAAARSPSRARVVVAGLLSLTALVPAGFAVMLEVAPHAFEVPTHTCPFCLLKLDAFALGYPLFGAIFFAVVWAVGAAVSALVARGAFASSSLASFARRRFRLVAIAWLCALALGAAPIVRFTLVAGGASLFDGR